MHHSQLLITKSLLAIALLNLGMSSRVEIRVAILPPLAPQRTSNALVLSSIRASGPTRVLRVLLERWTARSEGMESMPEEGMMIAWVLVAR